jgi:hypothetical protein
VKGDAPVQIPTFDCEPDEKASEQEEYDRIGEGCRRGVDIRDAEQRKEYEWQERRNEKGEGISGPPDRHPCGKRRRGPAGRRKSDRRGTEVKRREGEGPKQKADELIGLVVLPRLPLFKHSGSFLPQERHYNGVRRN